MIERLNINNRPEMIRQAQFMLFSVELDIY
jgi:hypothetical protein